MNEVTEMKPVNMEYVVHIQRWLLARTSHDPEAALKLWDGKQNEISDRIIDEYQLGHSSNFDFDEWQNAVSFFDCHIDRILGVRAEDEGEEGVV